MLEITKIILSLRLKLVRGRIGTIVAFISGWSLLAFSRLSMDIGILVWNVTLVRLACTFFFPPIAGFLAYAIFGKINF